MKKTIRLTESQLTDLITKVINEQFMGPTADDIHYNLYGTHLPPRKTPVKRVYTYLKDMKYYDQYLDKFKQNFESGLYNEKYKQMLKGMDSQSKSLYDEMRTTNEAFYYGMINNFYLATKNFKIKNLQITIKKVGDNDYQVVQAFNKIND